MRSPKGQTGPDHANDDRLDDEVADDKNHWLGLPIGYSPYHPGYTTKHWLMVFRTVEPTA